MALRDLSPAQARVLYLTAQGMSGPEIADYLSNSPWTIQRHKRHVLDRLEARTMAHAVAVGFCSGVLRPEQFA